MSCCTPTQAPVGELYRRGWALATLSFATSLPVALGYGNVLRRVLLYSLRFLFLFVVVFSSLIPADSREFRAPPRWRGLVLGSAYLELPTSLVVLMND